MARFSTMGAHSKVRSIIRGGLRLTGEALRLPLLAVVSLLAPVVQVVCGGLFLLGVFVSIAFKVSGAGATFPFWHMIGISLGFAVFAILHYALIGLLSR
jgi:hypothetical protein